MISIGNWLPALVDRSTPSMATHYLGAFINWTCGIDPAYNNAIAELGRFTSQQLNVFRAAIPACRKRRYSWTVDLSAIGLMNDRYGNFSDEPGFAQAEAGRDQVAVQLPDLGHIAFTFCTEATDCSCAISLES